jgi:hypothetical protein
MENSRAFAQASAEWEQLDDNTPSAAFSNFHWCSEREVGRPARPDPEIEKKAREEFLLSKSGLSLTQIRDILYPEQAVETEAIRKRIARYKKKQGHKTSE